MKAPILRTMYCEHCRGLHVPTLPGELPRIEQRALEALAVDLEGCPDDCWRFFAGLFTAPDVQSSVKVVARDLAVSQSTVSSRFYRAGLPSPKRYLAMAMLVRVAGIMDHPGASIARAAAFAGLSSGQSLSRAVRTFTGETAGHYFSSRDASDVLDDFRDGLIKPYLRTLLDFSPLVVRSRGLRREAA